MSESHRTSRRRLLACSGVALSTAVAGCTGGSDESTDDESTDGVTRQPLERSDWEGVDEIRLEGYLRGWIGVEPDPVAGIRNPSILLIDGNEYDLTWENGDGSTHNIALWDESDGVVDGKRTKTMKDRGQTQSITFDAAPSMHRYVCEPHRTTMVGHFKVVD